MNFQGYLGVTASNTGHTINDVDILSVKVYDTDPNSVYMDMVESQGNLDMLINSPKFQRLLSVSCPDNFKSEVRAADVSASDTTEQTLYKMWETLTLYNINIAHMIRLLKDNQQHQRQIAAQAATDNDLLALTADIAKVSLDLR